MGQKFAAYDDSGAIVAFYDSKDSPPPAGASVLAITDAEWQTCISTPGYTISGGALLAPPAPTDAELLAGAQATQIALLRASCSVAIVSGFTSSALGSPHTYPTQITDQINLMGAAKAGELATDPSWTVSFWCVDGTGTWVYAPHTAAQIAQAFVDGAAQRMAYSTQLDNLTKQVMAALSPTAVQSIVWTSPLA